ncbi:MAG: glycosyltransferase family A protein [Myxococcota bacterium]
MENAHADRHRIVIISPVRDEELTLERTIACVEAQTLLPVLWVLVDDGSTDRTPKILAEAAARISWLRVVSRADRGFRKLGSGVVNSFNSGLETVDIEYDFLAKMDVDLEFSPGYLETLMAHFEKEPSLAAASGKVFRLEAGRYVEEFMIDEMVAGQFKLYRKENFEAIGGFVSEVMWDGIDFHTARIAGYRTVSLPDPELRIVHLRLMGSSDKNVYQGRMRWGRGQWFMGSSFFYMVASGAFRTMEKPYLIGGMLMVLGYLQAAMQGAPRYEQPGFRKELRRWQRQRLLGVFRGKGVR